MVSLDYLLECGAHKSCRQQLEGKIDKPIFFYSFLSYFTYHLKSIKDCRQRTKGSRISVDSKRIWRWILTKLQTENTSNWFQTTHLYTWKSSSFIHNNNNNNKKDNTLNILFTETFTAKILELRSFFKF